MSAVPVEVSAGPWRAAVLLGVTRCRFEPVGWVSEIEAAGEALSAGRSAVVELRRSGGGLMPWALLAGEYQPEWSGSLRVRVGHTGQLTSAPTHDCSGMLGRSLAVGLPEEFAQATLNGLVRFDPELNRSGELVVGGGAYDEADSSEYAFEHAAALLKWALLGSVDAVSAGDLEDFLRSRVT